MPAVIGHERTVGELKGLAAEGTLGHGIIFFGPSMVGKCSLALAFAHFLEKGTFEVPATTEVLQDARVIGPAAGDSVGIDAVREARNFLWQKPNASPRRTLVIDGAELMTTEAQNALLKIAEEPPASSLIILLTSDIESIMPTLASRLPVAYLGVVPRPAVEAWLVSEHGAKKKDAAAFAEKAMGKPGLALRLMKDEAYNALLEAARGFLKTTPATRKDFIKKLIEPDEFSLRNFLDAVIITLAWEKPSKARAALWHKALALQERATNFGLNPRLQLEALLR